MILRFLLFVSTEDGLQGALLTVVSDEDIVLQTPPCDVPEVEQGILITARI